MKTNASHKTIIKAVENVSKQKYENNLVFRTMPEKVTKNVTRFTLKTLKANKPGSLTNKLGVTMTKANWNAYQDVMYEILRLDPKSNIYVDTIYGRQHSTIVEPESEHREKRKYTRRENSNSPGRPRKLDGTLIPKKVMNMIEALKYIVQHPSIGNQLQLNH